MYIGIDIGTSSVKAVLFDGDQRLLAQASEALTVQRPHPGWSEQDPEAWWGAVERAVDALAAERPLDGLRGIGLSGQMHGAVCLDHDDKVLRPAILWNDGRAAAECAALEAAEPRLREIAGNIAMPGFTAPKILWLKHHEPEVYAHIDTVLLPKDYVRFRLTGHHVSDMSDAAGTLWLDVAARDWSDDLLEASGLNRGHMPRLVEGSEPSGDLRPELAARWGCRGPVVVAGGAGDNAAAACGVGVVTPGSAFVSLGTSGVLFVSNDRFSPNTRGAVHAFCHAIPETWHQMGVILSASDSLEWLARITGKRPAELAAGLGPVDRPSEITFLPYLSGERTPHNDANARGAFTGLSQSHGPADLTQAVMEGVAYAFADCQAALGAAGTDFASALAVGGGARSETWLRIIANVLNRPLEIPADADVGGALGAARLAICAAEGADPHRVCAPPAIRAVIEPERCAVARYADGYARYRALYPATKEI
ncbi:xylulokinase [Amaricoccus solimangrovi]|uniref:Xylulose kinase n=1 Tax=Amaricoccus solimangrovi TaxID=2589815 RepID=A0A501WIT1_9RHOB|nr:xylulokinase [Amaricoccus solimangrovi]TPE49409.1 xylulokinase [Amaricoccus solimangrovi]